MDLVCGGLKEEHLITIPYRTGAAQHNRAEGAKEKDDEEPEGGLLACKEGQADFPGQDD